MPKIYGFKIFGMRGSKYELKFDYQGKPINEDEIKQVLKKDFNGIQSSDAKQNGVANDQTSKKDGDTQMKID